MQAPRTRQEHVVWAWPDQRLLQPLRVGEAADLQALWRAGGLTSAHLGAVVDGGGSVAPPGTPAEPSLDAPQDDGDARAAAAGPSRLEWRMLNVLNAERARASLPPLTLDPPLHAVARERAERVAADWRGTASDGCGSTTFFDLLEARGIQFRWAGENLARNACSDRWSVVVAAADLMGSPRHRENILAPFFTHVGVGMAEAEDGTKYFAMLFTG